MSVFAPELYVSQFTTNINMLLQQMGGKFADKVTRGPHTGKKSSPVDQVGSVEMQKRVGRFGAMGRVDASFDRRWVYPSSFDLPQLFDSLDKLMMISDPQSVYVRNAVMAAQRKQDHLIVDAFFADAQTGEEGGTTTSYTAGNTIGVAVGGANSRLNVKKIKALKELMETNHVDFETEEVYLGITAKDQAALLDEVQIISRDFRAGEAPVLEKGKVTEFLGFQFVQSEFIETRLNGTNVVDLPVWVKSGMHLGDWEAMKHTVSQRADLAGLPWQVYTELTAGATRIEEVKVYKVESYRA